MHTVCRADNLVDTGVGVDTGVDETSLVHDGESRVCRCFVEQTVRILWNGEIFYMESKETEKVRDSKSSDKTSRYCNITYIQDINICS